MIESLAEPERLIGQVIGAGGGALELEKSARSESERRRKERGGD